MRLLAAALLALLGGVTLRAEPLVDFPTDNHALLDGRPEDFFMYVHRDFEGEKSQPWQAGQYGYVRDPRRIGSQVVYAQIHEGIDIRPTKRDEKGDPLDEVRAAASGTVVHTSPDAGASNYGRYIVIQHQWGACHYYTLYAHLSQILVSPGQAVHQGEPIGVMGFTGAGIDRERAHLHFEVCLLLSNDYDTWHNAVFRGSPNRHGLYNGLNLAGFDPAAFLLAAHRNPSLRAPDFIAALDPSFKITVPNRPDFDLIRNYPWLLPDGAPSNPPAWTITFSRHAVPIKVEASPVPVSAPVATWARDTGLPLSYTTKGLLAGSPSSPRLTDSGLRFAQLLIGP